MRAKIAFTNIKSLGYNEAMDRKSKILLWVVVIISVVSVGVAFYKTIIKNDFEVVSVAGETSGNE